MSTPKIIQLLPVLSLGREKNPFLPNPIPYPEYTTQAFLVNITAPYNILCTIFFKMSFASKIN